MCALGSLPALPSGQARRDGFVDVCPYGHLRTRMRTILGVRHGVIAAEFAEALVERDGERVMIPRGRGRPLAGFVLVTVHRRHGVVARGDCHQSSVSFQGDADTVCIVVGHVSAVAPGTTNRLHRRCPQISPVTDSGSIGSARGCR